MKVLFVNPPFIRDNSSSSANKFSVQGWKFHKLYRDIPLLYQLWQKYRNKEVRYGVRAGSRWPWTSELPLKPLHYPFIMAYAASYLKEQGHEVQLIDSIAQENYDYQQFLKQVKNFAAEVVILETSAPSFDIDIWLSEQISKFSTVALAGPHLTHSPEKFLTKYPFVRYLLPGEYIQSALKMVNTKKAGIYPPDVITDLDSIPYPLRDYPESTKYFDFSMPTPQPQLQIYASKGCPFRCVFCLWPQTMFLRKTAYRSPENILKEIKFCINKYKYKSIFFDDDTFNIGTERISILSEGLKNIGLPWTMMGRLDTSPDWLFDKMVDSGCVGMRFGVETFDKNVMKNIEKGLQRKTILHTIKRLTKKYPKLMIRLFMMRNLPGQTEKIHQNDLKILHKLGYQEFGNIYRQYQLSTCSPFPGTKVFEQLPTEIKSRTNFSAGDFDGRQKTLMTKF